MDGFTGFMIVWFFGSLISMILSYVDKDSLRSENKKLIAETATIVTRLDSRREAYLERNIFPVANEIRDALDKKSAPKTQMNSLRDLVQEYLGLFGIDKDKSLELALAALNISLISKSKNSKKDQKGDIFAYDLTCTDIRRSVVIVM